MNRIHNNIIVSPMCSLVASLNEDQEFSFQATADEMIFAYLNQYRFIDEINEELLKLYTELNELATSTGHPTSFTPFDVKSLSVEPKFRHYAHLLFTGLKTLMDLFVCLVDLCQNRTVRAENEMPDFFNYRRKRSDYITNPIPEVINQLNILCDDKTNWINTVHHIRNRIIHRGYLLRPEVGFKKLEKLTVKTYKGNNYYMNIDTVNVGELFKTFSDEMNGIETTFVDIFKKHSPIYQVNYEVSIEFHEMVNHYHFKRTKIHD